jgi:CRISPR-associated endonuclease/helicase Cas3
MTQEPKPLLAKSTLTPACPRSEERLLGHTAQVVAAAEALLQMRGEASLLAAGLPVEWLPRLERLVRTAAFVHDLGKCSDHFQAMIWRQRKEPQLVRHEALSLWLCWRGQPLHDWLLPAVDGSEIDLVIAVCAAAGHHRKFWSKALADPESGAGTSITLLTGHDDFAQLLASGAKLLRLGAPLSLPNQTVQVTWRTSPQKQLDSWATEAADLIRPDSAEARLLALVKALVLDADVAGSALPRSGEKKGWIQAQLSQRATRERLTALVEKRLQGKPLRAFQREVASSAALVTLVRAGCGTGKTVAAYQWCAEQHPGRQLWVTYPTTGTTTEGYRDYVQNADVLGLLDHSRAEVDLEIFGLLEGNGIDHLKRDLDRLKALRAWGAEVVTCTVDTVLGLVQNQRKGLYAWAGLADAAIVFDEIHAYDDALFAALLRFLEALPGIPALLMTASLPTARLSALRACVERAHHRPLAELAGPEGLERLPRYQHLEAADPWVLVNACLADGGKVLWVSNTVNRCVSLAASAPAGMVPLIYHSRFRYIDRVTRHGDVIEAFKRPGAALALTTQVAEMSLDLSADLLVTDLAPIPALIQRLGRLNRHSTPEDPAPPKPFVVLDFEGLPYEKVELDDAHDWLARLGMGTLSQRDLVHAWEQRDEGSRKRIASEWLDGRFRTEVGALREASPGVSVLLSSDADAVESGETPAMEVLLPMNPPPSALEREIWKWRRVSFCPVAPAEVLIYDCLRGARWRK